jgi:N-formylmaleamate deformylase
VGLRFRRVRGVPGNGCRGVSTFLYGAHLSANGIRQHYLRYGGSGKKVVLIPGITSPAVTWGFVAEALGRDFDVYVIDVRGRGLSSTGPRLDYGLDTYADDLVGFIHDLGLKDVTLVGHSMGARIAVRAAARGLAGFESAVLVDPPVSGPGRRVYPGGLSWYIDSIELAEKGINANGMRVFCPTWTEEQLQLRAEWLHTCYLPAIVQTYKGFHLDDIHRDLPRMVLPTLLMLAEQGGVVSPEDVVEIRALIPHVVVRRIENAGHMIPWDNFEGFMEALRIFLKLNTTTATSHPDGIVGS